MKRWSRYSLRAALLAMLIAACFLAFTTKRYRDIKMANAAIKKAGGTCGYAIDGPEWLRKIVKDEQYFMNPLRISLGSITGSVEPQIDDDLIAELVPHINRFSKFATLDLRVVDISDDGVASLQTLTQLKTLRLGSPFVTDAGIQRLASFAALEKVTLRCPLVSEEGLAKLQAARPSLEIDSR